MDFKTGIGAVALVVGTALVFALASMQTNVPHLLGGLGVLAMAGGSLAVGMSDGRAV